MTNRDRFWMVAAIVAATLGCARNGGPGPGVEGGRCYGNGTCNDGLTCLSSLCVRANAGADAGVEAGGPAGGGGGSGSGAAGTAATAGVAGAAGSGGVTESGGADGGIDASAGASGATDGGNDATDGNRDGGGTDVVLMRRKTCPQGPFDKPKLGQAMQACAPSAFRYDATGHPAWVGGQNAFFFSNFPSNATGGSTQGNIIKYTPGGACEIAFSDVGTQGLAVTPEGRLVGASHKTRSISEIDLGDGHATTLVDMALGLTLDIPMAVVVHDNGTIYFANRAAGMGGPARLPGGVYRVDKAGNVSNVTAAGGCCFFMPGMGGLALAPDDTTLYARVAGTFDLDASGVPTASHTNVVSSGSVGGIAVDCAGNVYIAGVGEIANASLQPIGPLNLNAKELAFGGQDGMTLLVLNGPSVVTVPVNIPGPP